MGTLNNLTGSGIDVDQFVIGEYWDKYLDGDDDDYSSPLMEFTSYSS